MTLIKILALIGALLAGIPSLWGICYVLWEFAKCVRKMTWDELMGDYVSGWLHYFDYCSGRMDGTRVA